jgi:hypothetical protein
MTQCEICISNILKNTPVSSTPVPTKKRMSAKVAAASEPVALIIMGLVHLRFPVEFSYVNGEQLKAIEFRGCDRKIGVLTRFLPVSTAIEILLENSGSSIVRGGSIAA